MMELTAMVVSKRQPHSIKLPTSHLPSNFYFYSLASTYELATFP